MDAVWVGTTIQFVECVVDRVVQDVLEVGKVVGSQFPVELGTVIEPTPVVRVDTLCKRTITVVAQSTDVHPVGNLSSEFIMHFGISNHEAKDKFKILLVSLAPISKFVPKKASCISDKTELGKGSIQTSVQVFDFMEGCGFVDMESSFCLVIRVEVESHPGLFSPLGGSVENTKCCIKWSKAHTTKGISGDTIHVKDYWAKNITWSHAALLMYGLVEMTMM
jgi:hypothetical protein